MDSPELADLHRLLGAMGALYDTPYLSLWRRVDDEAVYIYGMCVHGRDMRDAPGLWQAHRRDLERGHSIALRDTLLCPLHAVDRSLSGMLMVKDPIILDADYADRFAFADLAERILERLGPALMAYDPWAEEREEAPAEESAAGEEEAPAAERQTHFNSFKVGRRIQRPRRRPTH